MIKVSVILPVYGVAPYIERCTRSLLAQTLEEMEFLFVDDHGPDDSMEVVCRTIEGHPRAAQFRFLDPGKNLGPGMARNFAIPFAEGEYVAFVDSDDWVEPDMFASLYDEAQAQGGVDLCYGQAFKDYADGMAPVVLKNPVVDPGVFTQEKRTHFLTHYVSYFWTYIFKREHLVRDGVRFPEQRWAEDSFFVSCSLLTAQSVAHIDRPLYHYQVRPGSASTSKSSTKYLQRIAVFHQLLDYAKEHEVYTTHKEALDFVYIKKCGLSAMMDYGKDCAAPDPKVYQEIWQEVVATVPEYPSNKYWRSNKSLRVLLWLSQHHPGIFTKLVRRVS